jgi:hypothetical protein
MPYDEYDLDEENGGQDPGGYYNGELAATGMFDLRGGSAALSVRNSRKLCHTTSMMSRRRMAVKTLAASTRRVRCDEYVRDLRDVSEALSVRNSRKLCRTTRMMSMRRMTVRILAASTTASKMR